MVPIGTVGDGCRDGVVPVDQRSDRRIERDVAGDDRVVDPDGRDVLLRPIDPHVDVGEHTAERVGARHGDAVEIADVGLMRVAGDDEVDLRVQPIDDVDDRAADPGAAVDVESRRKATFVDQHHDRLNVAVLEVADQRVRGVRLVEEVEPGDAGGADDVRRPFEGHADERHLRTVEVLDRVRREQRRARRLADDVGGEELEVRTTEAVAIEATVDWMAAAVLHPQELGGPLVELVVADGVEIESDRVHRLDRRLVVEQARQQGAGADQVTGRHDDRVAVRLLERLHVRRQVLGAASQRGRSRRGRSSRRGAGGFRGSR